MVANEVKSDALIAQAKTYQNIPWCEDYELMISGMLYNPFVPELNQSRFRARRLAMIYNNHIPEETDTVESLAEWRSKIHADLFGKVGKNLFIDPPFQCDYGCNITVGDDVYMNFGTIILDCSLVTIGNRVLFGPGVQLLGATHETGVQSRRDGVEYANTITIGDDCWIGGGVKILPGITIGRGCTIGAGTLVNKSIPNFSVAVGSPVRVIKTVDAVPDA